MITGINESRTLTKHISCKCQCNFDRKKCSSNQKWNSNKCWCECKSPKKHCLCKNNNNNNNLWNTASCSYKNCKYVGSIIEVLSVITCHEVIEETKTVPTKCISA